MLVKENRLYKARENSLKFNVFLKVRSFSKTNLLKIHAKQAPQLVNSYRKLEA